MTGTGCVPGGVLSAWLDDAATSEEGRTIDAHLPGCAACTSALIELGAVRRVVRTLPTLEVPAGLLLTG
ncbi:MAG: zf-HC2 domain-containing protein, partial [Actinomycetota bacterium]|nr:zf-HC2 domain-containing protein [Actinomycetota bacterium]